MTDDRREHGPRDAQGPVPIPSHEYPRRWPGLRWQRRLVDRALAPRAAGLTGLIGGWLVRRPLRDVLGFTRTRVPLIIGEPLPEASVQFLATLGIAVRNWKEAADWKAQDRAQRLTTAPDAAPSGFQRRSLSSVTGVQPV